MIGRAGAGDRLVQPVEQAAAFVRDRTGAVAGDTPERQDRAFGREALLEPLQPPGRADRIGEGRLQSLKAAQQAGPVGFRIRPGAGRRRR